MRRVLGAVTGRVCMLAALGLAVLGGADVEAAPPGIGRIVKRLTYEELLQSGQNHAGARKWPQAINDLQAALRLKPKDPMALSELSGAFLMSKRLDQAQRTAEDAVKFASTSELKSTGLLQLGRVAEARNRTSDAMEHYLDALKLRHNDETVRRIYQLNEWSTVVPCRGARSMGAICGCLTELLGGNCIGEDRLAPTVMRVRSSWTGERSRDGTASVFLALQAAGGWFLTSHLGRLNDAKQHHRIITDMKADVSEHGARRVYRIEYTSFDDDLRCTTLSNRELKGLGRTYNVECIREDRHVVMCVSSEDGQSVECPIAARIGCKRSKPIQVVDEFFSLGPTLSAKAREWESRFQSSAKAQLSLAASGVVTGTALPIDPAADVCPEPKAVEYRLY